MAQQWQTGNIPGTRTGPKLMTIHSKEPAMGNRDRQRKEPKKPKQPKKP